MGFNLCILTFFIITLYYNFLCNTIQIYASVYRSVCDKLNICSWSCTLMLIELFWNKTFAIVFQIKGLTICITIHIIKLLYILAKMI